MIALDVYPVVLGSRILGKGAREGGMPLYKYIANRVLTLVQNLVIGQKLSEYHTGYRAYSAEVMRAIDYHANSDDFIFDNQMFVAAVRVGFKTSEVTCPTSYEEDASSIGFRRAVVYGLQCVKLALGQLGWRLTGSRSRARS